MAAMSGLTITPTGTMRHLNLDGGMCLWSSPGEPNATVSMVTHVWKVEKLRMIYRSITGPAKAGLLHQMVPCSNLAIEDPTSRTGSRDPVRVRGGTG
jgi:hypothetical protein